MTWSRAGSPLHLIIGMGVWIPHWWCSLEFDGTKHLQPSTLVFNCNSRTRGKSCTQKLRNTLLYGYIQMDFTKCPIVGHLGSFKIFCYVNSVTVNILILISYYYFYRWNAHEWNGWWCEIHVYNTFITYYLVALQSLPSSQQCKEGSFSPCLHLLWVFYLFPHLCIFFTILKMYNFKIIKF